MSFFAFLLVVCILAVTPGPGVTYVVSRTVAGGRTEGLASCFGTAIGGMIHVLAAALGLSLLIAQSDVLFDLVQGADLTQGLGGALRLGIVGLEETSPRVDPALGVDDADLLGVARIGLVPIAEQYRARRLAQPQRLLHVLVLARLEEREANFASARLPSMTPLGAGAQCKVCVSLRLITGRTYLRTT